MPSRDVVFQDDVVPFYLNVVSSAKFSMATATLSAGFIFMIFISLIKY